jgi:hypothetical protein
MGSTARRLRQPSNSLSAPVAIVKIGETGPDVMGSRVVESPGERDLRQEIWEKQVVSIGLHSRD